MKSTALFVSSSFLSAMLVTGVAVQSANAAAPTLGAHPRLFLNSDTVSSLHANAADPTSATAKAIAVCDDVIANPSNWSSGGYEGLGFPEPFGACAIAWVVRHDAASGTAAVKYFRALLDDYAEVGDGAGGDAVVAHDDGYSMRIFAPYAAIGYDWLQDAPGVDATLLAHARERFAAWTAWYATSGYHPSQAGSNYNAGYVFGTTMIAVAEAGEAGGTGDALWDHVTNDLFGTELSPALASGGILDGGDWLEGWLAMSARALRDAGVNMTAFNGWETQLVTRAIYAMVPDQTGWFIGGDSESVIPYAAPSALPYYAAMADAAEPTAKAWAASAIKQQHLSEETFVLMAAIGEAGAPAPQEFPANSATWTLIPGSRTLHARTDWSADAIWMVTRCDSARVPDHMFLDAGNVVMSRGADHLIVDPSPYGSLSTLTGNAPTTASPQLPSNYQPSQGAWGGDDVNFTWATQKQSGIVAARCNYAGQYDFQGTATDVPLAQRDVVLVPYGDGDAALVVIDDVNGASAAGSLDLRFHSMQPFTAANGVARTTVGNSDLVVQSASVTAGSPVMVTPSVGDCYSGNRGQCTAGRFATGEWELNVPDKTVRSVTVLDAVATGATPSLATTNSGTGWQSTELDRAGDHVAIITVDAGVTSVTYTAGIGGHIVVGAPVGSTGHSDVTATPSGSGCAVTVTAHDGDGGFDGKPLAIAVDAACTVTEDPSSAGLAVPSSSTGGGGGAGSGSGNSGGSAPGGGTPVLDNTLLAGCSAGGGDGSLAVLLTIMLSTLVLARTRRVA